MSSATWVAPAPEEAINEVSMIVTTWLRARRATANLLAAAVCFGLFGYALYAQYKLGLEPCPLCIFQRIGVLALGTAFVLAALLSVWRARLAGFVAVLLVTLAGAATASVAGRHIWIQAQPAGTVPACGAPLEHLWEILPVMEVLRKVFEGSGECSAIDWTFLGLSMPGWVLLSAVLLTALGIVLNWPARRGAVRG
jgi:protein dithiol:quinone oxidoreductase